jgi:hypothetical protein
MIDVIDNGTGPLTGATLGQARDNTHTFIAEVIAGLTNGFAVTTTRIEHSTVDLGRQEADGRYTFTAHLAFVNGKETVLRVSMPGLPLDRLTFGADAADRPRNFPRMYLDGMSWLWPHAVRLGQDKARRDAAPDDRESATFIYRRGLPDVAVTAAWGCRAIVNSGGMVDVLPDRQGCFGDEQAVTELIEQLNTGGLGDRWRAEASRLLVDGTLRGDTGREVELLDEDGVRVVANTNGSAGYLYVIAYVKPKTATAQPDATSSNR